MPPQKFRKLIKTMKKLDVTVKTEDAGERLDRIINQKYPELTRSYIQQLIESGNITIAEKQPPKSYKVRKGDIIDILLPEPEKLDISPEKIELDVIFEDEYLLVVNKPKGMVVHPAPGNYSGTLVNALLEHCGDSLSGINGVIRPGIVHRIDKDTSGLLIVAKNDNAHKSLAAQIKEHSFRREYMAVLSGNVKNDSGIIDVPLGRSPKDRKKQAANGLGAREALTEYSVLERYRRFCLVRCTLKTGRTHQIRVHMAYIAHPVAGDTVYGGTKNGFSLQGQCLHAATIGFVHPKTNEYLEFTSPLPDYFRDFINKISMERNN